MREVQKTLTMEGVDEKGSRVHRRLEALVAAHRAVMVIFMQVPSHSTAQCPKLMYETRC